MRKQTKSCLAACLRISLHVGLQCLDPEPPWWDYDIENSALTGGAVAWVGGGGSVRKLGFTGPILPKRKARLTEVN